LSRLKQWDKSPVTFRNITFKPLIPKTRAVPLWTATAHQVTWGEVTRTIGATEWGFHEETCASIFDPSVTVAYADDSKISPELRNQPATQQTQVIVQYAPGTQVNCSGLLGLVGCLVNDILKLGGTILSQVPIVNGVVALLDGNGIHSLSNQSNVVYISLDRPLKPTLSNAASAVNAEFAWQSNYTGAGIGIALIDSGVASHPDLNLGAVPLSRVVYQQSFVPGNSSASRSKAGAVRTSQD
jgi:hypothetical protein